ncbi:hypothetical protein [Streptomyces niveus]|uniref:hypothetical protein n=1 Tax=Streptomyces niveus TaxID=193462 RepID=UPI0036D2EFB0
MSTAITPRTQGLRAAALAEQRHQLDPVDVLFRAVAPGAEKTTPTGDCGHSERKDQAGGVRRG